MRREAWEAGMDGGALVSGESTPLIVKFLINVNMLD